MTEQIYSTEDIALYKRKINRQVEPVKVMLVHRKEAMSRNAWVNFVDITRQSILDHPDQYLERDIPSKEILKQVIDTIFREFLEYSGN